MQFSKKSFKFQFQIIGSSVADNLLKEEAEHGETHQCMVGNLFY
jgi:hypothetical protein